MLIAYWAFLPYKSPEGTGFDGHPINPDWQRGKTLWDWLELLIIPAVLAGGAWWLNKTEKETDREVAQKRIDSEQQLAKDKQQEDRLQTYFDRMTELLLKEGLRTSKSEDEVRSIARTRTLSTLRTLDGTRKGLLLRFLEESGLIKEKHIVDLANADLSGANLSGVDLRGVYLIKADLRKADLSGANLRDTNLSKANLSGANLTDAQVTDEQLAQAKSLEGTTMPDGTVHE